MRDAEGQLEYKPKGRIDYLALKVKEHLGRLNQQDFDALLALDFEERLKDNPPIEGVFSPEDEIEEIKNLPKGQKRDALVKYKENLPRHTVFLKAKDKLLTG